MARFHLDWEVVEERMTNDPKEIAAGWKMLIGLVKKDMEKGTLKDWGAYPGDKSGYSIAEGSDMDILMFTMQYAPFIRFKVRPVSTLGTVEEFLNAIT